MNDQQKLAVGLVAMVAVGVAIFALVFGTYAIVPGGGGLADACSPLSYNVDENGTYVPPMDLTCVDGVWVNETKKTLSSGTETYCQNFWKLVTINYVDGVTQITETEAQGGEYCENGKIINSTSTCGNYKCDVGEDKYNCWVDCGVISSWEKMYNEVTTNDGLQTYIESEGVFRYDYPAVEELAKEVEATNPSTPLQAVKTLTRKINSKVSYVYGGVAGNVQCGENSQDVLDRGTGNCVDYSTILIATLRRGFDIDGVGRVQIPARQVAGCLNGFSSWKAVEYNILDDNAGLRGQVLGHSWVKVWVGQNRWVMADPTTNTALAKSWAGYHEISVVDGVQECYISRIEDRDFCTYFSTTGA